MATLLLLRCCSIEEATRSASEMKREGWDGSLSSSNCPAVPFFLKSGLNDMQIAHAIFFSLGVAPSLAAISKPFLFDLHS